MQSKWVDGSDIRCVFGGTLNVLSAWGKAKERSRKWTRQPASKDSPLEFCVDVAGGKDTHVLVPSSVLWWPGGGAGPMQVCYQPSPEGRKPVPVSRGVGTRSRQRRTVARLQPACPSGEHVERVNIRVHTGTLQSLASRKPPPTCALCPLPIGTLTGKALVAKTWENCQREDIQQRNQSAVREDKAKTLATAESQLLDSQEGRPSLWSLSPVTENALPPFLWLTVLKREGSQWRKWWAGWPGHKTCKLSKFCSRDREEMWPWHGEWLCKSGEHQPTFFAQRKYSWHGSQNIGRKIRTWCKQSYQIPTFDMNKNSSSL